MEVPPCFDQNFCIQLFSLMLINFDHKFVFHLGSQLLVSNFCSQLWFKTSVHNFCSYFCLKVFSQLIFAFLVHYFCKHLFFTYFVLFLNLPKFCPEVHWQLSFENIIYNSQVLMPSLTVFALLSLDPATHPHVKLYFHSPSPCLIMQMKRLIATVTEFYGEKG